MTVSEFEAKGGAAIGFAQSNRNAKLKVSEYRLELNAGLIGKAVFMPGDVDAIDIDSSTLGRFQSRRGIRITHHVSVYRKKIIFYPAGDTLDVLNAIWDTGFLKNRKSLPYGLREEAELLQTGGTFPLKTWAVVAIIVIWNIFCLYGALDFYLSARLDAGRYAVGAVGATGFMIITCAALIISPAFRELVMKKGHNIKDIRGSLFFIIAICAFILMMNLGLSHSPAM